MFPLRVEAVEFIATTYVTLPLPMPLRGYAIEIHAFVFDTVQLQLALATTVKAFDADPKPWVRPVGESTTEQLVFVSGGGLALPADWVTRKTWPLTVMFPLRMEP